MNKKYNRRKKFHRKSNRRKSNKRKNRKKTNRKRNLRGGMLGAAAARGEQTMRWGPDELELRLVPDEPPGVDLPDETPPGDATPDSYTERIERCKLAQTIQALGIIASEDLSIEDSIIDEIRGIVIQRLETMRVRQDRTKKTGEAEHPSAFTPIGGQAPAQAMSPVTLSSDIRVGPREPDSGLISGEWSQITFITNFFPDWDKADVVTGGTSPLLVPSVVHDYAMRSKFPEDIRTILSKVTKLVIGVEDAEAEEKSKAKGYLIKGLTDLDIYFDSIPDDYISWWMVGNRPFHFKKYAGTLEIDANGNS